MSQSFWEKQIRKGRAEIISRRGGLKRGKAAPVYSLTCPATELGFKTAADFDHDWEAWEEYQDRYWGQMKNCALSTVIGHKHEWLERDQGRNTGPREICLTPNQVKKLWGSRRPPELLGCGVFACAWVKSPRRVVKITTDPDDVRAMIASRGMPHVVQAYKAYRLMNAATDEEGRDDITYAVVAERLYPMPPELHDWVEAAETLNQEFVQNFEDHYGTTQIDPEDADSSFSIPERTKHYAVTRMCSYEDNEAGCSRFARQLVNTVEQLGKRGISVGDLHTGNVGVTKSGIWKILDLGISGTGRQADAPPLYGLGSKFR